MKTGKTNKNQLLYVKVHDQIKEFVQKEGLQPGDRLPSETEFMERLGVSRGTVRQAMMLLRESGFVYSHQGNGSFLRPVTERTIGLEQARQDVLQFATVAVTEQSLLVDYVPSSKTVEDCLGYEATTLMARFQRLYYHGEQIIAYRLLLAPYGRLEESQVALDDMGALTDYLDSLIQDRVASSAMTVDFVRASELVAGYMGTAAETYLFCISDILRDRAHASIGYSKFYCHPEYFKFTLNRS